MTSVTLAGVQSRSVKKITSQSGSMKVLMKAGALPFLMPLVQPWLPAPEYLSEAPVHWSFWYKVKIQSTLF